MQQNKYLITFSVPEPYRSEIIAIMDHIELLTGMPAPHKKMDPHMTFHRPITGISEEQILNLTQSMALQVPQTRIVTHGFSSFGKKYIVLPVHGTLATAALWIGLNDLLLKLPEYIHGPYDNENTLHITLAEGVDEVFDYLWPALQKEYSDLNRMEIPLQTMDVWKRPAGENQRWMRLKEYELPLAAFMKK